MVVRFCFAILRFLHVRSSPGHSMVRRLSFAHSVTRRTLLPICRSNAAKRFTGDWPPATAEAACHSDGARLVNSATEYMGKALITEGMDRLERDSVFTR